LPRDCGAILVADDDQDCRSLISAVLLRAGFGVEEAATGEEAIEAARQRRPSAVVLEVCLPGLSGYEVCWELREAFGGELPILFVSGRRTEPFDRVAGLLVGADDYVVKPFAPDELLARLRTLVRRAAPTPRPRGETRLTERELQVLRLLAEGLGQREIAERLVITSKTVATYVERILDKLGVHSRAQAVALAYREQLVGT
jgi:DNA-binding NarL/FixJ family response regulator